MISTNGGSHSTPTSAGISRLCHICGVAFPKASLPSHQKSCIRKSFGMHHLTRQMATLSAGNTPTYPCGHCLQRIPKDKMNAHLRTCRGSSTQRQSGFSASTSSSRPWRQNGHMETERVSTLSSGYEYDFEAASPQQHQSAPHSAPIRRTAKSHVNQPSQRDYGSWQTQSNSFWEVSPTQNQSNSYDEEKDVASSRAGSARILPKRSVKETRPNTLSIIDTEKSDSGLSLAKQTTARNSTTSAKESQKYSYELNEEYEYPRIQPTSNSHVVSSESLDQAEEVASEPVLLIPCDICNRKFKDDRLEKHRTACLKAQKSRKVFDASSARVKGTEMEKFVSKAGNAMAAKKEAELERQLKAKKSHWRAKHEAFVQMVRSARNPDAPPPRSSKSHGGDRFGPTHSTSFDPNPDYVTCPTCNRRFNEDSGARHMTFCKEKQQQQVLRSRQSLSSGGTSSSKEMLLKKRTAYKPPAPKVSSKK